MQHAPRQCKLSTAQRTPGGNTPHARSLARWRAIVSTATNGNIWLTVAALPRGQQVPLVRSILARNLGQTTPTDGTHLMHQTPSSHSSFRGTADTCVVQRQLPMCKSADTQHFPSGIAMRQ
jgi:hypothetical protein